MNTSYTKSEIVNILYKARFQNQKVNQFLKSTEQASEDFTFDGTIIRFKQKDATFVNINIDNLANRNNDITLSQISHRMKGKAYNKAYQRRLKNLVYFNPAFAKLPDFPKKNDSTLAPIQYTLCGHPKHQELSIASSRWSKMQSKLADKHHTDQLTIPVPNDPYESPIRGVEFPHSGTYFNYLNLLVRKEKIDPKGFLHFKDQILDLTFDISIGKINKEQEEQIHQLKDQIGQLDKACHMLGVNNLLASYKDLLNYELKVLNDLKKAQKQRAIQFKKPFNQVLKTRPDPCKIKADAPKITIGFTAKSSTDFDKRSFSQYLVLFKENLEFVDTDTPISFEKADLKKTDVSLLIKYFNQGKLKKSQLEAIPESQILFLFDFATLYGIPHLEAQLGKEITQRIIDETWKDSALIINRKGKADALRPIIDFVT